VGLFGSAASASWRPSSRREVPRSGKAGAKRKQQSKSVFSICIKQAICGKIRLEIRFHSITVTYATKHSHEGYLPNAVFFH